MTAKTNILFMGYLLLLALFSATGCAERRVTEVGMTTLQKDTIWSGVVKVTGDVYVPPGVTLTIAAGSTVKFARIDEASGRNFFGYDSPYYPQAEIIVRGRLLAQGTKENIIVFTSAERDAKPADWGAINLLGCEGNVIEYCKILFAYNGIHAHGAAVRISRCEFSKNGLAISVKKEEETPGVPWFGKEADITATHNLIHNNKGGITYRNSRALISYNTIKDNKLFGVWPKETNNALVSYNEIEGNQKGVYLYHSRGTAFRFNNICNNKEYNIAIADEQDDDVDARNNWFGTVNKLRIEEQIFDRNNDPAVARVMYEPFLNNRVKGAGE